MKQPEIPANEENRISSLCSLGILDTPAEKRFDRITRIAKRHFDVPIVLVSLVDTDRQWFKSRQGLGASETPRNISFCGHAILNDGIFHIPNALEDERFVDNPLVTGPPNIRFYAGAPLHAPDGQRIGTLCIIDDKPREFSSNELSVLRDLADTVEDELKFTGDKTQARSRHIYPITTVVLAIGALLTALLFFLTWQIEEDEIRLQLQTLADERSAALAIEAQTLEEILHSMSGLYAASKHVDREEFVTFLTTAFPKRAEIRGAAWIEYFQGENLQDLYQQAEKDGYQDYRLLTQDGNKKLVTTEPQLDNLAVYHVYNSGQVSWFPQGLNLASLPVYDNLLQQAADSGQLVSMRELRSYNRNLEKSFELFLPVYRQMQSSDDNVTIKQELRGFVALLVNVEGVVEEAYGRYVTKAAGLDFYVVDIDPRREQELLYFHASRARTSKIEALPLQQVLNGYNVSTEIKFADSHWRMVLRPIPGSYEAGQSISPWLALGGGLLFTLFAAGYLNNLLRSRATIEQQVEQRTYELNDSREQTRAVLDTVVDGIITIDSDGIVQTFNPAAGNIFAYAADEVIGNNINMLMPEPYHGEHDGYLKNYLTTGVEKVIGIGREVTGKRSDDSTFPMELSVSEMAIHGKIMFTGIVRDITERKKSEEIKTQFISTVSHELRTPLTSIRGALGLVLGGASGELPAKAKTMIEMASRNSERLTLLINDILDLEKLESGKLSFDFKPVDLEKLTHQALESNQGYAVEHGVSLELKNMIPGVMIEADDHRLLQVFANLISNAVKFSPEQGVVEISVTRNNDRVRVSIRDYGPGISEEFESKIFQRFSQADSSDTREKGGTGLGLSITKALVEQHHGQIGYLSPQGGGTEFYIELPELSHFIETSEAQTSASHVLICEDNTDVAQVLGSMLAQEGLSYDVAGNAAAAKQLLARKKYSALLLDLGLPDQNGLDLIQELKKDKKTENLPIIVVSASAEEGRLELNGDGFDVTDWIQKPIDEERLRSALNMVLNSSGNPRVLHVEDSIDVIQVVKEIVGAIAEYEYATTLKSARSLLSKQAFDLVIIDVTLPDGSGLELIPELDEVTRVIVFSGNEIDEDINKQINASLTKSTTSNEKLLDTIKRVINDSGRSINE